MYIVQFFYHFNKCVCTTYIIKFFRRYNNGTVFSGKVTLATWTRELRLKPACLGGGNKLMQMLYGDCGKRYIVRMIPVILQGREGFREDSHNGVPWRA